MSGCGRDANEAPRVAAPGASRTARVSLGWSVLRNEPAVKRRTFGRWADALAYRLIHLVFCPPPAALSWRDGYLEGWRDATRRHVQDFLDGMGRPAQGGIR